MNTRAFLVHMETTTTSRSLARSMVDTILRESLAANAWLSSVASYYLEGGKTHHRKEYFVAFKTTDDLRLSLLSRIRALHDESSPYIGWIKLHEMPKRYAQWVEQNTRRRGAARGTARSSLSRRVRRRRSARPMTARVQLGRA